MDHEDLTERLRKTLYYGKLPGTDRPSLPLTDIAVEFFQEASPKPLGKLDPYLAASTSRLVEWPTQYVGQSPDTLSRSLHRQVLIGNSNHKPSICILPSMFRSACMSAEAMMVGMMYVRRLRQRRPDYLTQISSSELFLISMMMASKFLYDEGVDEEVFNDEWAESGDTDVTDVNQLERDFLSAIDWQLFVRPDEFAAMLDTVEKRIAHQQGCDRGWFSYTDMSVLSEDPKLWSQWSKLVTHLSKVLCVSSVAYLAGILTLVTSTAMGTCVGSSLVTLPSVLLPLLTPVEQSPSHGPSSSHLNSLGTVEDLGSVVNSGQSQINETADPIVNIALTGEHGISSSLPLSAEPDHLTDIQAARKCRKTDGVADARESRPIINGLVSSMLTLMTLKETLVSFVSAIYNEQPRPNSTWDSVNPVTEDVMDSVEVCSEGACMLDSWPGCWNVSSEHDWSRFKSDTARDSQRRSHCDSWRGEGSNRKLHDAGWQDVDRAVGPRCCCRLDHLSNMNLHTSLYPAHLDLGFATRSALPLVITN